MPIHGGGWAAAGRALWSGDGLVRALGPPHTGGVMSARVESRGSSSVEPVVCEMPPPEPKVAAAKVCKASRDEVERFRATENDERATFVGRTLEQYFLGTLSTIPEGG